MIPYIIIFILSVSVLYYRGKYISEKKFAKHINDRLSKSVLINLKTKGLLTDVNTLLGRMWSQSGHLPIDIKVTRLNFKHSVYTQSEKLITEIEKNICQ